MVDNHNFKESVVKSFIKLLSRVASYSSLHIFTMALRELLSV